VPSYHNQEVIRCSLAEDICSVSREGALKLRSFESSHPISLETIFVYGVMRFTIVGVKIPRGVELKTEYQA